MVTPRPFYRSRAFWLGLPGLAILLWGWWVSTGYVSWARVLGADQFLIGQCGGGAYAIWDLGGSPDGWDGWEFVVGHEKMSAREVRQLKAELAGRETNSNYHYFSIPYYWPVLAYTATWLLTLAWWQRRKSRLMKLHAAS